MALECPYCAHNLTLKGIKPGRYSTKCPKCTRKFQLLVLEDPAQTPVIRPIKAELEALLTQPSDPKLGVSTEETQAAASSRPVLSIGPGAPKKADELPPTLPGPSRVPAQTEPAPRTNPAASETLDFTLGTDAQTSTSVSFVLGGYQILKELGRGGMGVVYLARQRSLNRDVALKVMKPEWARNAMFVARFTREAYAAAQLTHHNVVQIYDFGEDHGTNFFSMEFVNGQSLAGLVKQKKRLEIEEAVGYVLQAARGLKYAHDQNMIHRDVKPENLLLNAHGIIKVADLGLVKTPEVAEAEDRLAAGDTKAAPQAASAGDWASVAGSSQITVANVAMGTPAFMAPEQARDASRVDARADIYSLGCTLYHLITGRPPFEGRTALEVITKHQTESITPPDIIDKRIPKPLSEIMMRMVAKRPEDRFPDLSVVIQVLEEFLGIHAAGPFKPREEHAQELTECIQAFNSAPTARLRAKLYPGLIAGWLAIVALCIVARSPFLAGGLLGLGFMSLLANFLIDGVRNQSYLFLKVRELVLGSPLKDWVMAVAAVGVIVVALFVLKLFWAWVLFGVVAVLIAFGLHLNIDRLAAAERKASLDRLEIMLKSLRLHGLDEDALRQFVCMFSGDRWEELFETLFGFEAKLDARRRWALGTGGRARPKYAAWREPIINWIDAKILSRRREREKALLEKIEEKSLQAAGENLVSARRKAHRAAEAMVTLAAEIKQANTRHDNTFTVNRSIAAAMREAATKPEKLLVDREKGLIDEPSESLFSRLRAFILGPRTRFLAGSALIAGSLLWMNQNAIFTAEQVQSIAKSAAEQAQSVDLESLEKAVDFEKIKASAKAIDLKKINAAAIDLKAKERETKPLELPMLPRVVALFLSSFGAAFAGLILVFSSFFSGTRIALFALPAAAITVIGPRLGLPTFGGLDPSLVPILAGLGLMATGVLFGRSRFSR